MEKSNNILYYGYIRFSEPESYLAKLRDSLQKNEEGNSSLESNYAIQIVINSRIAFKKYFCFKVALSFTIIAILIPIGYFLLQLLHRR